MKPDRASIVIVGGGIVGCSIAYHLADRETDVVVIEKGELTSGSTWHAAGLVGQLRSSLNMTTMLGYNVDLYRRLEKETEQPTGWKQVGGLRLASSTDRMIELKKAATTAKSFGLAMELLTPEEACKLFPPMSPKGIVGAAFLPTDGYTDPTMTTMAIAHGARMKGVKFIRNCRVTGITLEGKKAVSLQTDQGEIRAEIIVNAAGMWARDFGKMAGVNVPLIPVQHQYMISEPIKDIPENLPTMRDPDNLVYYKEEVGGLCMGGYEPNPIPWSTEGIPREFGQELLPSDFDHFSSLAELALKRTPVLETVGVRKLINGPEAFTPDGHFILGRAPELSNYFVAAGFNAHGIAAGGGVGRMMAEWILDGKPSLDLWEADIRRFGPHHRDLKKYVIPRTLELYGKHYTMHWPSEEHESARGWRKTPLYDTLKSRGAVFGSKFGWERPNWFAPTGVEPKDIYSFDWPNWHPHVGEEHRAIRERVALIDQSSFSKMLVTGPGALALLQKLAVNQIDKPVGTLTYTQFCNESGGIEADLTIHRWDEEKFYVVTGTAFGTHDFTWMRDHAPTDGSVVLKEVTDDYAVINVCGPRSRELIQSVTEREMGNDAFPFAKALPVAIGSTTVIAARVTYVGELGWELHTPMDKALEVYNRLWEAGQRFKVANAGYRAIETCRLEKGYLYWSADLSPDYNPYESGLGFCVKLKKGEFIGREALTKIKAQGNRRKLCCFTLERPVPLHGKETLLYNGKVIGVLTSGGYGHTVGKSIAYAFVPNQYLEGGEYCVEVLGQRIPATREEQVLYDPHREKILS